MLISEGMNAAINEQIGKEFEASLQYVQIAAYFDRENLPRLAAFFYKQAEEEREHALKFVKYVVEAGGTVSVPATAAAKGGFGSAEEPVRLSLEWEMEVTRRIHALADRAIAEKDHTTRNFLEWFVSEQLEEVSTMDRLLSYVRRAGERGLLIVENYLAETAEHGGDAVGS